MPVSQMSGSVKDGHARFILYRPAHLTYSVQPQDGSPIHEPIVEPWKCPYHNGRMCMEVIGRLKDAE